MNYIGLAILIVGIALGEFIYWRGLQHPSAGDDPLLWQHDSGQYQREVETYSGGFGLLVDQWSRALANLGQPTPLAITIVIISALASATCFLIAQRQGGP
ncbi:MAG: hypothetical protein ABSE62_13920 [Chthoniobacteraceae bacterium]